MDDRAQGAERQEGDTVARNGEPETPSTEPSTTTKTGKPRMSRARKWDRGRRPGQNAIAQRVAFVASLYIRGYATREIYDECRKAAEKEHAERKAWAADPNRSRDTEPSRIWDAGVPHERTVDGYIRRTKAEYVRAAQEAKGAPAAVVGLILARNNLIFAQAIEQKNLAAAARCNELLLDVFGLKGAIKLEVFGPSGGPIPVEHSEKPTATTTEAQRAIEIDDILTRALRMRAAAKGIPLVQVAGAIASRGTDGN